MDTFSIWHWLVLLITLALWIWVGRCGYLIAKRAGLEAWTGALLGIPLVNVFALWILALRRWPAVQGTLAQRG